LYNIGVDLLIIKSLTKSLMLCACKVLAQANHTRNPVVGMNTNILYTERETETERKRERDSERLYCCVQSI
jgi:hypothetical protein